MPARGTKITQLAVQKCSTLCWYSRIPTSQTLEPWWYSGQNVRSSIRRVTSSILARGTKIFVTSGEHGLSFFQVKCTCAAHQCIIKNKEQLPRLGLYQLLRNDQRNILANYILSHVQILSVQTNKQLMAKAEYDNNINTTTNSNLYFIHWIKIHQMLL